jgi:hypothetical protein
MGRFFFKREQLVHHSRESNGDGGDVGGGNVGHLGGIGDAMR